MSEESPTVAELRRNDPNEKVVTIQSWLEQDDVALAEALEQNDYVDEIRFDMLEQLQLQQQPQRCDNLLRVLATREKLEKVQFDGSWKFSRSPITEEHAMILQAVQRNPFVHTVVLSNWNLSSGEIVSSLLDTATSLTEFGLQGCGMTAEGAGRIAASLQRNTNLQTLGLANWRHWNLHGFYKVWKRICPYRF